MHGCVSSAAGETEGCRAASSRTHLQEDRMSITDYREQAKQLSEPASKLLAGVMEKYTASILEEMHDQLMQRDAEIEKFYAVSSAEMKSTKKHIAELERALADALVYCESGLPVSKIRGERWRKLLGRDYKARKPK